MGTLNEAWEQEQSAVKEFENSIKKIDELIKKIEDQEDNIIDLFEKIFEKRTNKKVFLGQYIDNFYLVPTGIKYAYHKDGKATRQLSYVKDLLKMIKAITKKSHDKKIKPIINDLNKFGKIIKNYKHFKTDKILNKKYKITPINLLTENGNLLHSELVFGNEGLTFTSPQDEEYIDPTTMHGYAQIQDHKNMIFELMQQETERLTKLAKCDIIEEIKDAFKERIIANML